MLSYPFTGNWSPRLGINVDPFGDRKGKVFFNYGRNYWAMPLDAANRQLGNEQDDTGYYFAPVIQSGALVIVPDNAHTLNGMPKSTDPTGAVSEFRRSQLLLFHRRGHHSRNQIRVRDPSMCSALSARSRAGSWSRRATIDRRLARIIEDIGTQSPEGSTIGGNYTGGIANPGSKTDIAVNEQEVTYTPTQWAAANPTPASRLGLRATTAPVQACTYGQLTPTSLPAASVSMGTTRRSAAPAS